MKLTEKTKKYLVITGSMILGIGLLAAIGMQFGQPPSEDVLPETTQTVTEVIVDPGTGLETQKAPKESVEESGGKTDLVIQPGTEETNETTGQAADSRPAQTDQTQQSIQPEPTKPEPPREEMLTDPTGSVTLVQHYPKTTPVIFWSLSILISLMTERQSVRFSSRVKFS